MTVVEKPMTKYLFSLYGTAVRYATASPLLAAPVNELLRHFRRDSLEESAPSPCASGLCRNERTFR